MRTSHRNFKRAVLVACLSVGLLVVLGVGAALAQTPPKLGDPVGTNVAPHGGYSSTSNFCLQCHSMHAAGEYALMAQESVDATCNTCHTIGGSAGTPRSGMGTASTRAAYINEDPASEHGRGATEAPGGQRMTSSEYVRSSWNNAAGRAARENSATDAGPGTASADSGGLYCASCHTPHGDYGAVVNQWRYPADEGSTIQISAQGQWQNRTLDWDAAAGAWKMCTPAQGAYVEGPESNPDCGWATMNDSKGSTSSLYGYKLLSAYPNHTYADGAQSWGVKSSQGEYAAINDWCASCHEERHVSAAANNHDGGNCLSCHGAAQNDEPSERDFPHTSKTNDALLRNYGDVLCVSCHPAGSLP